MLNRRFSLILMGATALVPPALAATGEDAKFAAIAADWLDAWCRTQPVTATQLGDHRFDTLIDDMSAKGRAGRVALWRGLLARLAGIDRSRLSRDNQVDASILKSQLEFAVWDDQVLQSWAWDALVWSNLAGDALYLLVAREFAPIGSRLKSAIARMKALPALLEQMRASIVPARVPAIHATTVARQNSGVMDIVDSMIAPQAKALGAADQAAAMGEAAKSNASYCLIAGTGEVFGVFTLEKMQRRLTEIVVDGIALKVSYDLEFIEDVDAGGPVWSVWP